MPNCPVEKPLSDVVLFDATSDTAPLAALHAACFATAWDATAITALLGTPGTFAFHHPDGFVMARAAGDEAEILTLAVAPDARGRGLGRALLRAAIIRAEEMGARAIFLEVGADNPQALALYEGLGFAKVGTRRAYYSTHSGGSDALVLRLSLPAKFA
jgi:ribosomal-protein-alanine N-acetyltransferase